MSENQNIINENVVEKAEKQVRVKPVPDANFDWNCDPKKDDSHKAVAEHFLWIQLRLLKIGSLRPCTVMEIFPFPIRHC